MPDVRPFRGLRFDPFVVGDLSGAVCPPYDIISAAEQRELYQRSPYNAVRLELAEELLGETAEDNRYTRAASLFQRWLSQRVLASEPVPAMYLMEEEYTFQGEARRRKGLICCVRLEEFEKGVVLPHEYTTSGPKQDRLELMKACHANFSPIMSFYRDPGGAVAGLLAGACQGEPEARAELQGHAAYKLWAIKEAGLLSEIRGVLAAQPIYLADGHHRYETALQYRDLVRRSGGISSDNAAANFVMMTLISLDDPGLLVLPYHRLLGGLGQGQLESLRSRLEEGFDLQGIDLPFSSPQEVAKTLEERLRGRDGDEVVLGAVGLEVGKGHILTLKPSQRPGPGDPSLQRCDTWVLHERVLKPAIGEEGEKTRVSFVHEALEALEGVVRGEYQVAFLLRPMSMDLFEQVVSKGERLPPKSTYFYPKLPTGLVINHLVGEVGV